MCTANLTPVKGPLVGWKVVCVRKHSKRVYSPIYCDCVWTPNTTKRNSANCRECCWGTSQVYTSRCNNPSQQCVFHCFATREQAREYKSRCQNNIYKTHQIIKLVLTRAYKGHHELMCMDGQPAHCGRRAYWDGKFHR